MKKYLIAVMLALASLAVVGCANVGKELVVARTTFNASLASLHSAHVAGIVTSKQEAEALPYLKVVQAALDAGDAAYLAGDSQGAKAYYAAALAGLTKLDAQLHAATQPTTKPAH